MRGRSWSTRNPAPRLRWPTSLLPIWPAGRPTASPEAARRQSGYSSSEPVPVPHRGRQQRVALRVVVEAEPVEDDEDDGHEASSAARRIAANASGFNDAPPTSAPSMSGWLKNSAALASVTLPPYWIGISSAPDAIQLAQDVPDLAGHGLGIGARRGITGPDGPHRLVGDDEAGAGDPLEARQTSAHLPIDDRLR